MVYVCAGRINEDEKVCRFIRAMRRYDCWNGIIDIQPRGENEHIGCIIMRMDYANNVLLLLLSPIEYFNVNLYPYISRDAI